MKQHCFQVYLIKFDSIGFVATENVGLDTKINTLGQLEAEKLSKPSLMAAIL